jgi:hypothetical protein
VQFRGNHNANVSCSPDDNIRIVWLPNTAGNIINQIHRLALATSDGEKIKELKLAAKWSTDSAEKKKAIAELSKYGSEALPAIEEVLGVTAYDDVKAACIEAIKSAAKNHQEAPKKAKRHGAKKRRKGKKK